MLARSGCGFGATALAALANDATAAGLRTHIPAKAESVVFLYMNGGPSGLDLFDYKPALEKLDGKSFPGSIDTLFPYPGPIMKSPFQFKRHGESGSWVSECYSHLAEHVDDMAFLHACHTDAQNHSPACYMLNTGLPRFGAPGIGSWLSYGLGNATEELPAFIVMCDHRAAPEGGANLWDAGFLPGQHQAVHFRSSDTPILFLDPGKGVARQSAQLQLLQRLNRRHQQQSAHSEALETRIKSFETAFRMQSSVPDLADLSGETEATRTLYGLDDEDCSSFGSQLLLSRRMVEQGVRCIQIYHGGYKDNWDHHANLESGHSSLAYETDRPIAGFLTDLKQRGLLDTTLVVWGGEFGRTPTSQDRNGRDHNPHGFCMWMAGGGTRGGIHHGELDELGYKPVSGKVSMHDLHATILHLMGLDHEQLTQFFSGRDQSLTNGLGSVIHDVVC
jgi:hypothetical protein